MPRFAPWLVALFFAALVGAKFSPTTGFTALIRFGETHAPTRLPVLRDVPLVTVPNSSGYDGQFYAQVALAPSLRDPALATAVDAPSYRARRIALPATAYALGLGQPALVLNVFALLNVAAWFAFAYLLHREIHELALPHAFARWLACVFALGVLDSVRQSLVDLPALLLLLLAVRAHRRSATRPALFWSALGHLTKETNLLATAALFSFPRPRGRQWLFLGLTAVPLAAWMAYVATRLPPGETGLGNFTWPFVGAIDQFLTSSRALAGGDLDSRHLFAAVAIPGLLLQAWLLFRLRAVADPWWRIGLAYGVLLLVLGPWVWSGYWAACRAVMPLTIAFNLLLPANRAFWPLFIFCNLPLLHAVWRFL